MAILNLHDSINDDPPTLPLKTGNPEVPAQTQLLLSTALKHVRLAASIPDEIESVKQLGKIRKALLRSIKSLRRRLQNEAVNEIRKGRRTASIIGGVVGLLAITRIILQITLPAFQSGSLMLALALFVAGTALAFMPYLLGKRKAKNILRTELVMNHSRVKEKTVDAFDLAVVRLLLGSEESNL